MTEVKTARIWIRFSTRQGWTIKKSHVPLGLHFRFLIKRSYALDRGHPPAHHIDHQFVELPQECRVLKLLCVARAIVSQHHLFQMLHGTLIHLFRRKVLGCFVIVDKRPERFLSYILVTHLLYLDCMFFLIRGWCR